MATRLFGLSVGQSLEQVTESVGPAVQANNIEINVDLATVVNDFGVARTLSRNELLIALNILQQYIIRKNWPPA